MRDLAKRGRNFWAALGFSVGLLSAGIATYWFLRRQVLRQQTELDQHIELPQSGASNGGHWKRPAGEILYIEDM
jgi:hypothetical protein